MATGSTVHSTWLIVGMQQMLAILTVVSRRKRKAQSKQPKMTEAEMQG